MPLTFDQYKQIADRLIDRIVDTEGPEEVIRFLLTDGFSKEEIAGLGFDPSDIEDMAIELEI